MLLLIVLVVFAGINPSYTQFGTTEGNGINYYIGGPSNIMDSYILLTNICLCVCI